MRERKKFEKPFLRGNEDWPGPVGGEQPGRTTVPEPGGGKREATD